MYRYVSRRKLGLNAKNNIAKQDIAVLLYPHYQLCVRSVPQHHCPVIFIPRRG